MRNFESGAQQSEEFESSSKYYSQRTEDALTERLADADQIPKSLHHAMEYACLGGGKRFRAMLVYACGQLAGAKPGQLDTPASAIEMVHAYSLIHDDLPAMDDDDLRRGRPTCHIQFGEAIAILAGDALQSKAFELLASAHWNPVSDGYRAKMVEALARAIGAQGMAGGQVIDMQSSGINLTVERLREMHGMKTGALIEASAVLGVLASESASSRASSQLSDYARRVGLAFQIADDVLDDTYSSEQLGKHTGADQRMNKSTYVSILGLQHARETAENLSSQAIESLDGLGDNTTFLKQLAKFVVSRSN